MIGTKSNECVWNGERVLIKCAHTNTRSIGVLYHMIKRIDSVFGALQDENKSFRVMRLPIARCAVIMKAKPTRSRGASSGRQGMIPRKIFEDEGRLIEIVQIDDPQISLD
jgi:hypothetical protein